MKKMIIAITLIVCVAICCLVLASCDNGDNDTTTPNGNDASTTTTTTQNKVEDEKPKSDKVAFLLIGQSNAAGRGIIKTTYTIDNDNCFVWREKKGWVKMKEPISTDKPGMAQACLATSFLDAYQKEFGGNVGVIEAAQGGTSTSQWKVGGDLYTRAVLRALEATEDGTQIVGILWHQGESDSGTKNYASRVYKIISTMLEDLSLPADTPVIVGELGEFYSAADKVNPQIRELAETYDNFACASSEGLLEEDRIEYPDHFDAPSLRLLGLRYFAEYYKLTTGNVWEFDNTLTPELN